MRRLLLALSLAFVALVAVGPDPAAAAKREPCAPKGARTVLLTEDIHVVARYNEDYDETRVWGCTRPRGRRFLLTPGSCSAPDVGCGYSPPPITAASKYVAFYSGGCLKGAGCGASVFVVSLRTGRRASVETDYFSRLAPVTRHGWLAWVDTGHDRGTAPVVRALNADGRAMVLDTGKGIDPDSIAVGRQRAYWTHDGVARSAALP